MAVTEKHIPDTMNFSHMLMFLQSGTHRARRQGWNGKDQWIKVQRSDEYSKMTESYIYIKNQQGGIIPWQASQGDMFAKDWEVFA